MKDTVPKHHQDDEVSAIKHSLLVAFLDPMSPDPIVHHLIPVCSREDLPIRKKICTMLLCIPKLSIAVQ